jgi:tRNA (guanosine-2'-O-)-methyltransferase
LDHKITNHLEEFVSENKQHLIAKVLSERTRHFTVVLEDLFDPHNISAVIRSCDCFGIQDLYITQHLHEYNVNPKIVQGASKWVTLHKFEEKATSTKECFAKLRKEGYRLVGTTPDANNASIDEMPIDDKTALVFGTELAGLSDFAKGEVDELVHIPMYGFTESFNISVSAALTMQTLVRRLKLSNVNWSLSESEKLQLKLEWYKRIVKRSDLHIKNLSNEE